jgi:phage regulator Rha-like protein
MSMVVMGFTGKKALEYQVEYAKAFEAMGTWITHK